MGKKKNIYIELLLFMLISVVLLFCCGSMCLLKGCLEGRQAAILCFVFFARMETFKKKKGNQQKNPQKTKALLFIVVAVALTP